MHLVEVSTPAHRKEFLQLPVRLYKDEPNYIRPIDDDVESVFDPQKNKYFRHGKCIRWIVQDNAGETVGRVAAFINHKQADKETQPTGGMGFFHAVNNQEVANLLFDACKNWLAEKGMEAMDGPINFGDRDRWWGLLANGYNLEPNYCMPYNFPYYIQLFENYGFQVYFKQFTYGRAVKDKVTDKMEERAARIFKDSNYHFEPLNKKNLDKYTEDFRQVYNKAWAKHQGVGDMSERVAKSIMKKLKPVMDPNIIWFGYYKNEPISFYINLPELNQIFKHLNGKLNWWGKAKFLYYKLTGKNDKMLGLVFGVVPSHQGKGIESAMAKSITKYVWDNKRSPYEYLEMNWIGDFNPKMINIVEEVGARVVKTHYTYRYLFDRSKPFERCPVIQ